MTRIMLGKPAAGGTSDVTMQQGIVYVLDFQIENTTLIPQEQDVLVCFDDEARLVLHDFFLAALAGDFYLELPDGLVLSGSDVAEAVLPPDDDFHTGASEQNGETIPEETKGDTHQAEENAPVVDYPILLPYAVQAFSGAPEDAGQTAGGAGEGAQEQSASLGGVSGQAVESFVGESPLPPDWNPVSPAPHAPLPDFDRSFSSLLTPGNDHTGPVCSTFCDLSVEHSLGDGIAGGALYTPLASPSGAVPGPSAAQTPTGLPEAAPGVVPPAAPSLAVEPGVDQATPPPLPRNGSTAAPTGPQSSSRPVLPDDGAPVIMQDLVSTAPPNTGGSLPSFESLFSASPAGEYTVFSDSISSYETTVVGTSLSGQATADADQDGADALMLAFLRMSW